MAKAGKTKATDPLLDVYNAIKRRMHRQCTPHVFICKYDLEQVWADHPLSQIFPTYDPEEWESIRKNYICVLSILVYIGWTDMSRFRPLFLREVGRNDAHLPFTNMDFLRTSEHMFSSYQHAFKPTIIEERNERHIQNIPTEHRLPFMDEPESMGNGGYGSVTKRVIAPRCLRNEEDIRDNPEPKPVACKVYKAEIPFQNYQDFKKEVGNLDFIKESLTESKRVMKHIAAIVHGDEFMIILPLANLYNLEIFLRGGFEPDPGTDDQKPIYDFDVRFPMLNTSVKLQHAVVEEAHQLASALKWLHEDLTIFGSSNRYLAHMDLKPANILLVGDSRLPAGKWMLSDFGVSAFDKATNAKVSDTPSIGDVGHRFTSRGLQDRVVRGHGSYQPPEVDLEDVDNRKCDVWSFSCVLCDILAFAIGKTEAVGALRKSRYGPDDDYFYETTSPTAQRVKEIDQSNTKLKSQIVEWWDSLERSSAGSSTEWVIDYIKVLRKALRSKPSDRPGISDIVSGLNALATSITAQANGSLPTNSHLAPSVPQINGLASQQISEAPHRRPSITISHEPSQQTHENDFRNVAPTAGSHGDFSRNLLSPKSALERKRVLPVRLEGDGIHDSSGTESLDHSATLAKIADVALDVPGRCLPYSPDEPSPERQTAIVNIPAYREEPKISISLPKKEHVTAVAIAPSTLQVAILFKNSVYLYSTTNGKEIGQPIVPSSKVEWTKIRLASEYFAVYGLGTCHEKHIEIFHSKTMSKIEIFDPRATSPEAIIPAHGEAPQDILLSNKDVFAYVYLRSVRLYFVRQKSFRTIQIKEINKDDAFIIQAKFGASGKFLCVWTIGTRADHAYFFCVNEELGSAILCGAGSYQKARYTSPSKRILTITNSQQIDTNSDTYNLWPFFDSPACVIHEAHGDAFLAQCLDRSQTEPQQRNSVAISNALTACVVGEDEPKCQRRIAGQCQDLCAANKSIEKFTATAARVIDGKSEIVLCTITGKVLRYVQS